MASVSPQSVTIDKGYFDTLVRRSEFNTSPFEAGGYYPAGHVSIEEVELENLRSVVRKYENLKQNLLRGGVSADVVDLLSKDDATIQRSSIPPVVADTAAYQDDGGYVATNVPQLGMNWRQDRTNHLANANANVNANDDGGGGGGGGSRARRKQYAWGHPKDDDVLFDGDATPDGSAGPNFVDQKISSGKHFDRRCTRSVLLTNLAEGTTHWDVTKAVRGGILLDVSLRSHDRSVVVSFLHALDANNFIDHVRKHDLYIKNKRVDVKWSDSQFTLPRIVASKIGCGATRNMVIRKIDGRHTEETIRKDLEHIHRLVIIRLDFVGTTCYVKTNSVHNALFARSCMMSRELYKSTWIEFDADECAQPYSKPAPRKEPRKEFLPAKKNSTSMHNRFMLLNMDGEEEEEEVSTTIQAKTPIKVTA